MTKVQDQARLLAGMIADVDDRSRSANAAPGLAFSSIEGGRIEDYDTSGSLRGMIGTQPDGTHTVASVNGPVPPRPTAPVCTGGQGTITARWDGVFLNAADDPDDTVWVPSDFARVEAHASTDPDFTALFADTLLGTIETPRGSDVTTVAAAGTWYVRLVARSQSGKASAASPAATVVVEDLVDVEEINRQLDKAAADLAAAGGRLDANDAALGTLTGTTLPKLRTDLDAATTRLAPLPGLIDANTTAVNAAKGRLDTLDKTTLPGLTTDLAAATKRLATAENTLAPLPGAVSQAQTDLTAAFGQLGTVDTRIGSAQTAAAADAKAKADAAQAAAQAAAAADAKAKADAAQAAAAQTAAADAKTKADAAQAAALAAAKTYADAQASGASGAALDAAKADAQAKADAAKQAAITAAAADAKAKADAAQAAAIIAAAADAKTKADAAQAAAVAAAAADAKAKADAAQQAAITAAASDAQRKADAALAAANAQIGQVIARGQNLVRNGGFEAGTDGWGGTTTGWAVETGTARSGTKVMRMSRQGANVYPLSEAVASASNRTWYIEGWWQRTGDDTSGVLPTNAVGYVIRANTASGGTSTTTVGVAGVAAVATTGWTKLSGTYSVATADIVSVAFGPWARDSTNTYRVDDMLVVDVTEAQAAITAANTAQQAATAAQTAAGAAKATADSALTMAGSKSNVYYSTSAPSGTGGRAGDLWRQVDASKNVLAEWYWTGTVWQASQITSSAIANLDVGKLTAGAAVIDTAVINKMAVQIATVIQLNADRITAGKITSAQVDTASLAVALATVLQLDAGAITAGTISSARLDVNDLAVKIATVISLDAGAITAGKIATARLDVTDLAVQIATVISLNADRITAGTIATARLDVVDIAAKTAAFQTVDVKNLFVTGTSTVATQVAQMIYAAKIAAAKITADEIDVNTLTAMTAFVDQVRAKVLTANSVTATQIAGGAIDGMTITGATVQTSATASRGVKMTSAGIVSYDAAGNQTVRINGSDNKLVGKFSTAPDGKPGMVLTPTDDGGAGLWFSPTGSTAGTEAAIFTDPGSQNITIRPQRRTTPNGSIYLNGNTFVQDGMDLNGQGWALPANGFATLSGTYIKTVAAPYGKDLTLRVVDATKSIQAEANLYANKDLWVQNAPSTSAGANAVIAVSPAGRVYRSTSSLRYKKFVRDYDVDPLKVMEIRSVTWVSKKQPGEEQDPRRYTGFIAEELAAVVPEFVTYMDYDDGAGPIPESVDYDRITALLVKHNQHLQRTVDAQQARLDAQQAQIDELARRLDAVAMPAAPDARQGAGAAG